MKCKWFCNLDLAASQGGNSELTKVDQIENNGVKIMGETNILNKLPVLRLIFTKNMFNFINNLFDKEKTFDINLKDEIIENYGQIMEIDPFIFRLSIFILSIFVGYYVVWSVTLLYTLH